MGKPKRPTEVNQRAKLVVDIAAGEAGDDTKETPSAVVRGREGGRKGGPSRAASMTQEERSEAARKAAKARWSRDA